MQRFLEHDGSEESRRAYLSCWKRWLSDLVKVNIGVHRQVLPLGTSDHTVLTSVHGALAHVIVDKLQREKETEEAHLCSVVPDRAFVDEVANHYDLARLGGLLSHVRSDYTKQIASGEVKMPAKRETLTTDFALFDRSVILFALSLVNPLRRLRNAHHEVTVAMEQEQKAKERLATADQSCTEAIALLKQSCEVFRARTIECVRCVTLLQTAYLNRHRASILATWAGAVLKVLLRLEKQKFLSFIPEAYATTVMHAFSVLTSESDPFGDEPERPYFMRTEARQDWLSDYADFIVSLVADPRIVSPDLSVSIVMAAKTLLGEPAYMHHIETCETRCEILVKALLRCYEGRYWVPSTDILVRFWAGEGYMFEACHVAIDGAASAAAAIATASAHASRPIRGVFCRLCTASPDLLKTFLNHLINHLNWTVSEFDQSLEEIRRSEGAVPDGNDQVFRKCAVTFELSVNLFRLLEAVVMDGQCLFFSNPDAQTNLLRVIQLLMHMLRKFASDGPCPVGYAQKLNNVALRSLNKVLMIAPVIGTTLSLAGFLPAADEMKAEDVTRNAMLMVQFTDVGMPQRTVDFLAGAVTCIKGLSGVTSGDIDRIGSYGSSLKRAAQLYETEIKPALEAAADDNEEDDDCPICYARPMNATFQPCHHQSCRQCIDQHLMNEKSCFFCKATIETIDYADADKSPSTGAEDAKAAGSTVSKDTE